MSVNLKLDHYDMKTSCIPCHFICFSNATFSSLFVIGHCGKSYAILEKAGTEKKYTGAQWTLLVDDDTLIRSFTVQNTVYHIIVRWQYICWRNVSKRVVFCTVFHDASAVHVQIVQSVLFCLLDYL